MQSKTNSTNGIEPVAKIEKKIWQIVVRVLGVLLVIGLMLGAGAVGFGAGTIYENKRFKEEAKSLGFAWHNREDGAWAWKTQTEMFDATITPLVAFTEEDTKRGERRLQAH